MAFLLLLAALLVPITASPASSQELGVALGRGSSDFLEMDSPWSWAVQVLVPLGIPPNLRLAGGYRVHGEEGRRAGTVCDTYWPEFAGCREEGVVHETRLTRWEVGLVIGADVADRLEIRGGGFRVRNDLDGSSEGAETGRGAGNFYPDGITWNTAFVAGLAWMPWADGRLGALGRVRRETLDFEGCVTDVGTPFCGATALTTLEVGVVISR